MSPSVVSLFFTEFSPELGAFVWLAVAANLPTESRNKISPEVVWLAVAPILFTICNNHAAAQLVHTLALRLDGCSQSSPPTGSLADLNRVSAAGTKKAFTPKMGSDSTQL